MSTYKELKLTILDNSNYSRWRVQVEDILTGEGVWGIVEGIQVMPPDEPEDEKKHQAYMKWVSGDGKARSILRSSIDEATFNQCRDCKTSAAILKRIQELKEPKTDNDLMSAMTDYFGLKWKDGDDANTFMSTLYVLSARIDECGKQVQTSDDWLIAKTLACLPSQYASFVASWNLMAGAKPKMSQFREQLLLAEKMIKGQGEGSGTSGTTGESLFTRGRRAPVGSKKPVRIAGNCHSCGKPGHRVVDCWSKGKGEANNQKNKDKQGHGKGSKESMMVAAAHIAKSFDTIIADSGATDHITNKRQWFRTLVKLDVPKIFVVGNNASIQATHIGTIDVEVSVNGKEWREVVWGDVHYAPEACDTTLLSTVTLERKGFAFSHANGKMLISRQGTAFLGGVRGEGTTYRPYMRVVVPEVLSAQSIGTWHQRLGHVSDELINTMVRNKVVDGLDVVTSKRGDCEACHLGKQSANSHDTSEGRECLPGERFHSDVCHIGTESWNGHRYFLTFKDERSAYRLVRTLASKHYVTPVFKELIETAERETGRKVLSIRTDNGTEYINQDVEALLREKGIKHERSPAYVKQANGMAERENRTLCDTARALLYNVDISKTERNLLWNEAIVTAAYLRNIVPNRKKMDATPFELWHRRKPTIHHLKVFGATAFVKIPEEQRRKMDPKSVKTVFVGYDWDTTKVYRVFNRDAKKVERVGDVVVPDGGDDVDQVVLPFPEEQDDEEEWDQEAEESEEENVVTEKRGPGRPPGSKNLVKEPTPPHPMETRSKGNALNAMATAMDPVSVEDALSREDAALWKKAMDEEMQSLEKNGTWTLEPLPAERRTVKCKWVFKSKTRPDGTLDKRKARLVACGYSQAHGIDYEETFAPVVRHESVRCVLAVAAALDLEMVQFDVKTAFLNGYLDETVFMEQPASYEDGTNHVCRLKRSLYGLKQSPRKWNERIDAVLHQQGFKPCNEDPCVYVKQGTKEDFMILCLYVDDGLLCGVTNKILQAFLKKLQEEFELTIHKPDCYVGMEISRDREHHIISIHQEGYIKRIIQRFGLGDGKTYSSPLDSNVKLVRAEEGEEYKCPYLEAIGCLIYISSVTRPDITYAVNRLASFAKHPSKEHWNMVKRVIRYLKGTVSLSVTYGTGRMELEGYCDSDWGGDLDERKSTSGYVFTLGGGPVAWSSQLQKLTALSAMEAEYVALAEGVKQNEWCKSFLGALGVDVSGPTTMFVDNQAAIALSKNPEIHKRSKHVAIRYHRIRQETVAGTIAVSYIPTDRNPADMLTKSVGGIKIKDTIRMLGMKD